MTIELTPLQTLAAVGGLIVLVTVWRLGARTAHKAAGAARTGARAVSLVGRVGLSAATILAAQWFVLTRVDNVTLQVVVLALPDLFAAYVLTRTLTMASIDTGQHRGGGRR